MSYKREFSGSVHYSGEVRYTYPSSNSGGSGSAHYSGTIPLRFNVIVDTDDFDASVNRTNTSLSGVAGSVVSMQYAQCKAIRESGQDIVASAVNGFFKLIGSEVSQQLVENYNKMTSSFALLQEQAKSLNIIHNQMSTDFNRIKDRYTKIFSELDKECYRRIHELDSPSFSLEQKEHKYLVDNYTNTPAMCFLNTIENANNNLQLSLARLKNMANKVVGSFFQNIKDQLTFDSRSENLSCKKDITEQQTYYMPNVLMKAQTFESEEMEKTFCFSPNISDSLTKDVANNFNADSIIENIESDKNDMQKINEYFVKDAETVIGETQNAEHDERVYKTIIALWQNV